MKTTRLNSITMGGLVLIALGALASVYGATDMFLQFGGETGGKPLILGESTDPMFKGGIVIREFSLEVDNAVTIGSATAGAGAGKTKLGNLVIKKLVDRTSPKLFQGMATGTRYPDLTLSVRKAGSSGTKSGGVFYVLKFASVFVTKIKTSSADEQPMEEITLAYGALEETYTPQDSTGSVVKGGWNQITNKPDFTP